MEELFEAASLVIHRSPAEVYRLVSDVTRMGDWSPVCVECWWDEGDGPRVGAGFTGRNVLPERTWETHSTVVAAEPGREFAFTVDASTTRWGYTFEPVDAGTRVTESWRFGSGAHEYFANRFGADAPAQIANRRELARTGMAATLAAIKAAAETSTA